MSMGIIKFLVRNSVKYCILLFILSISLAAYEKILVLKVHGKIQYRVDKQTNMFTHEAWKIVKNEVFLNEKITIRSGENSSVFFLLGNEGKVLLGPKSLMSVKRFIENGKVQYYLFILQGHGGIRFHDRKHRDHTYEFIIPGVRIVPVNGLTLVKYAKAQNSTTVIVDTGKAIIHPFKPNSIKSFSAKEIENKKMAVISGRTIRLSKLKNFPGKEWLFIQPRKINRLPGMISAKEEW
jgi:hypothetical protein